MSNSSQQKQQQKPSILGLYDGDESGCSYYRLISPFATLREYGFAYDWLPSARDGGAVDAFAAERARTNQKHYDIVTLLRPLVVARDPITGQPGQTTEFVDELIEEVHSAGAVFGGDMDDDMWSVEAHNPASKHFDPEQPAQIAATVKKLDFVTVSTPHLAKRLVEVSGAEADRVHVVPNLIDFDLFDEQRWQTGATGPDGSPAVVSMREVRRSRLSGEIDPSRPVVIGLQGGPSHVEDWKQVAPALAEISRYYGERVQFVISGFHPDYLKEALRTADEAGRVWWKGWVPFPNHAETVMTFDINLCPLLPTLFNRSKSNIKWLEACAAGAASVVSPTVYSDYVTPGSDALMVKNHEDPNEWARAVGYLIENQAARQGIARRAHQLVRSRYSLQARAGEVWHNTYLLVWKETRGRAVRSFMARTELTEQQSQQELVAAANN